MKEAIKVDRKLVLVKVDKLEGYLKELKKFQNIALAEYLKDRVKRRAIERLIQISVECATDINSYFLSKIAKVAPVDYRDSFIKMGEHKILPLDFVDEIAPSAGLRNRLVHEYDKIDDKRVHQSIRTTLKQYAQYIRQIKNYLQRL